MYRGVMSSALASHWRREVLRTSLWAVPAIEVVAAVVLFAVTLVLDRAAYRGVFTVPPWVISGTSDAARQILTAIAAAVITVVGVVFSIILVTLTLASTQFGPRMLRNFIRDRGTQLTLGMPAVMIRQLEALAKIMAETSGAGQRRVLIDQAMMIERASERSVPEEADRADVRRRFEAVLAIEAGLADRERTGSAS